MENINNGSALRYKEIEPLTDKLNGPVLVRKNDTNDFFVKKCYPLYLEEHLDALQKIEHRHLPKIEEVVVQDGKLWLYEEFVQGKTLTEVIQSSKTIETEQILTITMAVLEALGVLHNKGLVHRDVKPGNIMITREGTVKLIDFDAVRAVDGEKERDTVQLGTMGFAAPEQFGFAESDERSDLYSLGIVMNICSVKEYPKKHLTQDPMLRGVVLKATKLEPAERYQSALEMHQELRQQRLRQIATAKRAKSRAATLGTYTNNSPNASRWDTNNYVRQVNSIISRWCEAIASFFRKYIPGFRTEIMWKRVSAMVWYAFLIIGTIGNVLEQPTIGLRIQLVVDYFFMFILPIVLFTNFLDYQRKLPLFSSNNRVYRYIGYGLIFLFWIVITKAGLELNSFIYKRFK